MARPKMGDNDDKKRQYAIWLGIPIEARKEGEKTQVQFAKKLGLNPMTLKRWKKEVGVQEIARNALKVLGGGDVMEVINVMTSLARMADPKTYNDRRMFLEWQGQIGQKKPAGLPGGIEVTFKTDE